MLVYLFAVALVLYMAHLLVFAIGAGKRFEKLDYADLPSVTVIVAARNEESNILDCLKSLDAAEYPEDKLEIIIVNDHSTDSTGEIVADFIKDRPRFRTMMPDPPEGSLRGKANAIHCAVRTASGEVVMTTDADCRVSPEWIRTIASYYVKDVGAVCGYTNQYDYNAFGGMQSVDFIFLLITASGTINLKRPLSCIGNNMSYRKSVYEAVGGYKNIPFSVTEDFSLINTISRQGGCRIVYPLDPGALVTSKPCETLAELYSQKKRWGVGGLNSDFLGFEVMTTAVVVHLCMIFTLVFFSWKALFLILLKFLIDAIYVFPVFNRLKLKLKFTHFLAFEIFFMIYVVALPVIVAINRDVRWKDREFKG